MSRHTGVLAGGGHRPELDSRGMFPSRRWDLPEAAIAAVWTARGARALEIVARQDFVVTFASAVRAERWPHQPQPAGSRDAPGRARPARV
jgi:hypothetical protein